MEIDIVIAVFNQVNYTRTCLDGLSSRRGSGENVIVIDNGSTDETPEYLSSLRGIKVISNPRNLGCAAAWNQGVKAGNAPWVVILNNDVILPSSWLEGLLDYAQRENVDIASPALRQGECNYDLEEYSREFTRKMANVTRRGTAHGICILIRREVFEKIGYFDENFRIGTSEDTDFFKRAALAGFTSGITGRSLIHHFGSITQDYIKEHMSEKNYGPEHRAYFDKKWNLPRWKRILLRLKRKQRELFWRLSERMLYGHSLNETWRKGKIRYS